MSPAPDARPTVDEAWLREWIAFGMLELAVYLTKQAQFAAYLATRNQPARRRARMKNG